MTVSSMATRTPTVGGAVGLRGFEIDRPEAAAPPAKASVFGRVAAGAQGKAVPLPYCVAQSRPHVAHHQRQDSVVSIYT